MLSFFHNSELYSQSNTIDSLQRFLLTNISVEQKINTHLQLFIEKRKTNIDSGLSHLQLAKNLFKDRTNDTVKFSIYRRLAVYYTDKHNYDSVLYYADKALDLNKAQIPKKLIDLYSIIGTVHYYKGDYKKAVETHLEAAKISDSLNLDTGKARVFNNIGIAYIKLQNWSKAEEYMRKSLEICRRYDIKRGISYTLGNLGIIYRNQGKYEKAIKFYNESIKINRELNDLAAISRNYDNIGSLYERQENFADATKSYEKAIYYGIQSKNHSTLAVSHHNMASVQGKLKNYIKAKYHYQKSIDLALSLNSKDILKEIYLGKSVMYENNNEFKEALNARKQYEIWKDSIINTEHLSAVSELEMKYETEKKQNEILQLSEQKLKDKAAIEKQQTRIKRLSIGLIGLALLFGVAFIIFKQHSNNKKQQELITAIADTQIEERKRIAQDLHDGIGGSLALTKNKLESVLTSEKEKSKEVTEFLKTLSETSEQIRQISHNMMPGELVKFGLVSAVQTTLNQISDKKLETHLYTHDLDKRIDQTKEIHTFRIIQEIIQNVLKHAKASTLNIHLNKHAKNLSLLVEDDGVGFVYNSSINKGIGIKNIKNRVAYLNGNLQIDSAKGKGTTFNVQIPL